MAMSKWMTTMGYMPVRILKNMAMSMWMMSTMISTIPPTTNILTIFNNTKQRPHHPHPRISLKERWGTMMISPNPSVPMSLKALGSPNAQTTTTICRRTIAVCFGCTNARNVSGLTPPTMRSPIYHLRREDMGVTAALTALNYTLM